MALLNFVDGKGYVLENPVVQKILQDTNGNIPAQIYAYIPRDQFFYPILYPHVNLQYVQNVQNTSGGILPSTLSANLSNNTSSVSYSQAVQYANAVRVSVELALEKASAEGCSSVLKNMAQEALGLAVQMTQTIKAGLYSQAMQLGQSALSYASEVLSKTC